MKNLGSWVMDGEMEVLGLLGRGSLEQMKGGGELEMSSKDKTFKLLQRPCRSVGFSCCNMISLTP